MGFKGQDRMLSLAKGPATGLGPSGACQRPFGKKSLQKLASVGMSGARSVARRHHCQVTRPPSGSGLVDPHMVHLHGQWKRRVIHRPAQVAPNSQV